MSDQPSQNSKLNYELFFKSLVFNLLFELWLNLEEQFELWVELCVQLF